MKKKVFWIIVILATLLVGCNVPEEIPPSPTPSPTATLTPTQEPTPTVTPTPAPTEPATSQLQMEIGPPERDETIIYGYDSADFPEGVNPLNGLEVVEPELLNHPAMLVSITNFPSSSRPQAGLSFAPMVYDFFIGQGMDRFLGVFYGTVPDSHIPVVGDCEVNEEIIQFENTILGNRVWLDENENGRQDPNELGVAGVCVNLLDFATGEVLQSTTTRSNGYFGFDLESGSQVVIEVLLPEGFGYTKARQAEDQYLDSDIVPLTGWSGAVQMAEEDDLSRDAGLIWLSPDNIPGMAANPSGTVNGRVWEDTNNNGLQDADERGVADIQINIYADIEGEPIANAVTDVWGLYRVEGLEAGVTYNLEAAIPKGMYITLADQSEDDLLDSDIYEDDLSESFVLESGDSITIDAGITLVQGVGPVRSGRLPYKRIVDIYLGSCLATASQWAPLNLPICEYVLNKPAGSTDINDNFLPFQRMEDLIYYLWVPPDGVDYSGNSFSLAPPDGGVEVNEFIMSYNSNTNAKWIYDELAGGWLRQHDLPNAMDPSGNFYPMLDRLTQKQLIFNNVIIAYIPHEVLNGDGTIVDTVFELGDIGDAWLFRDGKMYDISWTHRYWDWEISTWQPRPFKFIDHDGNSIPLHPGNTWVSFVTPWTCLYEQADGIIECEEPSSDMEQWIIKFDNP